MPINMLLRNKAINSAERKLDLLSQQINPANILNCTSSVQTGDGIGSCSKFQYTLPNNLLSHEQRNFYEKNGFLVIKNLVPKTNLDLYKNRFIEICNNPGVKDNMMTKMKDISLKHRNDLDKEHIINKIQPIHFDEVFLKYVKLPQILRYVECFTGPDIIAAHSMLINKPPDSGSKTSRHPLHQDLHYFPFRPANRIVCSWTAMQKVTRQNGCLSVIPGSHKGNLMPHSYPKWENGSNGMYHGIQTFKDFDNLVYLEMNAGDTVFFHPLLIHGSGMNKTDGFRKAISCHYATAHCSYINVQGTTQENIKSEVEEMVQKKGFVLSYKDVWKFASIIVQGSEPNYLYSKL